MSADGKGAYADLMSAAFIQGAVSMLSIINLQDL